MSKSSIRINPAHRGVFTAKAKAAHQTVQGFAATVLAAPKGRYSPVTREQANFAHSAKKFKH